MTELFKNIVNLMAVTAIPLMILIFLIWGAVRKVKVYESFVEGAKEGFTTAIRIIPYLVAMLFYPILHLVCFVLSEYYFPVHNLYILQETISSVPPNVITLKLKGYRKEPVFSS